MIDNPKNNFQRIKEQFFFFIILSLYVFFAFAVFFTNITYKTPISNSIQLKEIYTADNKLIAGNILGYVYYLNTKNASVEQLEEAKVFINKYCPDFSKKELKEGRYYLLMKSSIPVMDKQQLPKLVICRREYYRHYPYGEIFAHPVGLFNKDVEFGLEAYNHQITNTNNIKKPIITTLLLPFQYVLYKELKNAQKKYQCARLHGIIQNEQGEILAMVSLPSFDPIKNYKTPKNTMNGAVYGTFEFGSTIKFFSFILALHKEVVTGDTKFNIGAGAKLGNHRISDVRLITGELTVTEILRKSSNIGTIQLSELIWSDVGPFYQELMLGDTIKFDGFKTSALKLDYSGAPKYVYQHYCMGYSFRTGMLQVLRAFSGVVTGEMHNPSLIKHNTEHPRKPIKSLQMKHKETIMEVLLAISQTNPLLKKHHVYGKTGTARILQNGRYIKNHINTFYLGMFVKNGQKYFILLVFEEPHSQAMEASANAKPTAGFIINEIMKTDV